MATTLLISSDPTTVSSDTVLITIQQLVDSQALTQIFFIGSGLKHAQHNATSALLNILKSKHQIPIGYCPSSAARHIPDYTSNLLEDYGLTQFYALLHESTRLEQL